VADQSGDEGVSALPKTAYSAAGLDPDGAQYPTEQIPGDSAIRRAWDKWKAGDGPADWTTCVHAPTWPDWHAIVVMNPLTDHRSVWCPDCFERFRRSFIDAMPFSSCDACDAVGPTQTYRLCSEILASRHDVIVCMRLSGWMQVCAGCLAEARPTAGVAS
jgi:hypothetical protein